MRALRSITITLRVTADVADQDYPPPEDGETTWFARQVDEFEILDPMFYSRIVLPPSLLELFRDRGDHIALDRYAEVEGRTMARDLVEHLAPLIAQAIARGALAR